MVVSEKWTTIPVVRGQFGGGTPLRVIGIYDTHSFGSLYTLGVESRRYGDAKAGYVVWARAPRWRDGNYRLGAELWLDIRLRTIYDRDLNEVGTLSTNIRKKKIDFLLPAPDLFSFANNPNWRLGLETEFLTIEKTEYSPTEMTANVQNSESSVETNNSLRFILSDDNYSETVISPVFVFDNVKISNLDADGIRWLTHLRYSKKSNEMDRNQTSISTPSLKSEVFAYKNIGPRTNLAAHIFTVKNTGNDLGDQIFLGGFESIRGIPDGAIYGNHALYSNSEVRYTGLKFSRIWFQGAAFIDVGGAGNSWGEAKTYMQSSAGIGLRISFPDVYRLVFRIDYGGSIYNLVAGRGGGYSAGMNQFFQPYRPL